jgi:hypothetical protein
LLLPLLTCSEDRFENCVGLLQDVIVPEAEHLPAEAAKIAGSVGVRRAAMLPTIRFYDQSTFDAREVRDAASDRFLPAKFKSA